jgi:hypothetical protein
LPDCAKVISKSTENWEKQKEKINEIPPHNGSDQKFGRITRLLLRQIGDG